MSRTTKPIKIPDTAASRKFTTDVLEALADDLKKGRIPLDRVTVSDNIQQGLRAIVRNTGLISYHVNYDVAGYRPYIKVGDHIPGKPGHMTINEARAVTKTIRTLAAQGIDVQEGLHERLIRELQEKGAKWRP